MGRLRSQEGFTLIEMLMAVTLMLLIVGATLTVFDSFVRNSDRAREQNAAQDKARGGIDRIARDMRNQATPTQALPLAVLKATGQDMAFITVGPTKPAGSVNDRNLMRVRYCLETATRTLFKQTQTWTTATPDPEPNLNQSCPGTSGWDTQEPLVDHVSNGARDIWTFDPVGPWNPPVAGTTLADIRAIDTTLFVDADPARKPAETRLNTTVRLRNQNRPPTGDFDAKPLGDRHVLLVAGASDDDGHSPLYEWSVDGTVITTCSGPVCDYGPDDVPAATSGSHNFQLRVSDPSDLYGPTTQRTVNVPA